MNARGLSLVELLCVLAIAGVLAAIAAPSWQRLQARFAVNASVQQAMAGLALARRTALATGRTTTFCPTQDFTHCTFAGSQWMVFINEDGGVLSRREPGERLLRRWPLPTGVRMEGSRDHVWYLPHPRAAATSTFGFCHEGWPGLRGEVIVSQTGRPRVTMPPLGGGPVDAC
jgi:prepilin-type N-terminal cleavage/methylation domain-containing protein